MRYTLNAEPLDGAPELDDVTGLPVRVFPADVDGVVRVESAPDVYAPTVPAPARRGGVTMATPDAGYSPFALAHRALRRRRPSGGPVAPSIGGDGVRPYVSARTAGRTVADALTAARNASDPEPKEARA